METVGKQASRGDKKKIASERTKNKEEKEGGKEEEMQCADNLAGGDRTASRAHTSVPLHRCTQSERSNRVHRHTHTHIEIFPHFIFIYLMLNM